MTYWLITTTIGRFQFNDQMEAPTHFLSGLLRHCDFISMAPIEAEDPTPAPTEVRAIERVDVNPHRSGRTHLLGGFNTGDGRWTCHADCWCKQPTEEDYEEMADHFETGDEFHPDNHPDARSDRKVREVNTGRSAGSPDHCGHCGAQGHRRSRLMKCMAWDCQGHCVQCLGESACACSPQD
tara:strand:- start:59 stop:601 length:543 start_codon:yes stop_codon:yes gene_type:complete